MAILPRIGRLIRTTALSHSSHTDTLLHSYRFSRGITTKLFVGGLSFYTTEDALRNKFSEFGEVVDVKIIMDRVSQRSKGFGFIRYASEADAERAKTEMNGKVLQGRIIFVDAAKPSWGKSQLSVDLPGATAASLLDRETTLGGEDFGKI